MLKISVFGLGYVGCITAACLAKIGHIVIGVDIEKSKVDAINNGHSPVLEPKLDEIIKDTVKKGYLSASMDEQKAVLSTDVSMVCVGTPSIAFNGSLDGHYIEQATKNIGTALANKSSFHAIVIRSTNFADIVTSRLIPILEQSSGKRIHHDFGVACNPEFLREGNSIEDFYNPAFVLIGELDRKTGNIVEEIYLPFCKKIIRTDINTASMVKYASNIFHAVKICFANEIGALCEEMGADSHKVMDIFSRDDVLNISARYLKPGPPFGGSCLPKDIRAILYKARHKDCDAPLIQSVLASNKLQIEKIIRMIMETGKKRIGIIGLSFKSGTDDLRESPYLEIVEVLLGKGKDIKIFDSLVSLSRICGANKVFLETKVPHISQILSSSLETVVEASEVIIIAHRLDKKYGDILLRHVRSDQIIIDLVRFIKNKEDINCIYQGLYLKRL